jgi:hypothetical protein
MFSLIKDKVNNKDFKFKRDLDEYFQLSYDKEDKIKNFLKLEGAFDLEEDFEKIENNKIIRVEENAYFDEKKDVEDPENLNNYLEEELILKKDVFKENIEILIENSINNSNDDNKKKDFCINLFHKNLPFIIYKN